MKNIIMIDLDGVLLNEDYQVTKNINSTIKKIESCAILVPNSDTPIKRLKKIFFEILGIKTNILIGEKGAITKHYDKYIFNCNNIGFTSYLEKIIQSLKLIDAKIMTGDAPIWIKERKKFKPNSKLVLIDNFRVRSICIFFLITDTNGKLNINNTWSQSCLNAISNIQRPKTLQKLVYNEKYGIAISNPIGISKTSGYLNLKNKYPNSNFFMIGDSNIDIIEDKNVIHLSVKNGSNNLKIKSSFISNYSYTEGLENCLNWILKKI